jgi:hypothetical protein
MSTVDRERFEHSVSQVAAASGVSIKPKMEDIYTAEFLPPNEDRMIN